MKRLIHTLACCIIASLFCSAAFAAQIRVYVEPFTVTGIKEKDELKSALQVLLSSRVSSDQVIAVDSAAGADLVVSGSYLAFGSIYSLDAAARDKSGKVVARAFEQGEDVNQLIPSIGKLAEKLSVGIAKALAPPPAPVPPAVAPAPQPSPPSDIVRKEAVPPASPEIVRPQPVERNANAGWVSQRLEGDLLGIAPGSTLASGERELFVVDNHTLSLYRQGEGLQKVAEVRFRTDENILGVDTADLDGDGTPEAYVTILTDDTLSSQVWVAKDNTLKRAAEKLPYFFRGMALAGGERRIYVQEMGRGDDFYGDVRELVKSGERYELKNPLRLPRFGFLYNFNIFRDPQGKEHFVVINEDGYLIVYSPEGEELWRSSDKFGGSETYFKREDLDRIRVTGDKYRWKFLEQRILVTKDGEVIVPRNEGTFVVGNQRSFRKSSIYAFAWNGSLLEEKWHTKEAQNYLADFFYDAGKKELVLLQVTKKEGPFAKGASSIAVKKVE